MMSIPFYTLNKRVISQLAHIGQLADCLGFNAYLVGGVVRDMLLRQSSTDWDILVEGDAIELAKKMVAGAESKMTVYEQFGTATVSLSNGDLFDFTTARSEHYLHPGALPTVKAATIKEDLFRRDFTINAMAISLNAPSFGDLQDFYGGRIDLKNKKIHILHEKSFIDDPTRILRAVRFETRFNFKIGHESLQLLIAALQSDAPSTVKPPRYFSEFRKFFYEDDVCAALKRLANLGGLNFISPKFKFPLKTLLHSQKTIKALRRIRFYKFYDWSTVYMLGLLSHMKASDIEAISKHFHLTVKEQVSLHGLPDVALIIRQLKTARLKSSQIYEILDPVDLEIIYFIRTISSVNIVTSRIDEFLQKSRLVTLAITGEDLQNLGHKPGREMGALLHTLLLKKIDGEIKTRKDEMMLAQRLGFEIVEK